MEGENRLRHQRSQYGRGEGHDHCEEAAKGKEKGYQVPSD